MRFEVLTEVNTTIWLLGIWRHIPEVVIIVSFQHVPEHFSYNDKCSTADIFSTFIRLALSEEEDNSRSWEKTRFGKSRVVGYFAGPFAVGRNKFSAFYVFVLISVLREQARYRTQVFPWNLVPWLMISRSWWP